MVLVAGIILAVTQAIQGLGIVLTKKLKNTTAIHITYFVGIILKRINDSFCYGLKLIILK